MAGQQAFYGKFDGTHNLASVPLFAACTAGTAIPDAVIDIYKPVTPGGPLMVVGKITLGKVTIKEANIILRPLPRLTANTVTLAPALKLSTGSRAPGLTHLDATLDENLTKEYNGSIVYSPIFRITPYLVKLLEAAAGLRFWIENTPLKVAWLPILQFEARIRATHSSTAIEGNPLTLAQVDAVAKGEKIGVPGRDKLEVENYIKVMRGVEKHAKNEINEKALLSMHKLLTKGLLREDRSGRYKEKQNYVVDEKGIRIFTPPGPKQTPALVKELLHWLNSSEAAELPPIITCAVFHHRLASIHPFVDGNGRLARAIGTWILYQRGFDTYHIFSLDDFFANDRKRYYEKLQQARDLDNNLTHWIEYVAEGVVGTLKEVKGRIEDLQISSKHDITLTPGQEELISVLRSGKAQGSADLRKRFKVSRARINQIIAPLLKTGLVRKTGEGRGTRYFLGL